MAGKVSLFEYTASLPSSALSPCCEIIVQCHDMNAPTNQLVPHPPNCNMNPSTFPGQLQARRKEGHAASQHEAVDLPRALWLVAIQVTEQRRNASAAGVRTAAAH